MHSKIYVSGNHKTSYDLEWRESIHYKRLTEHKLQCSHELYKVYVKNNLAKCHLKC
jgi:hypothetical protein